MLGGSRCGLCKGVDMVRAGGLSVLPTVAKLMPLRHAGRAMIGEKASRDGESEIQRSD